MPSAPHPPKFPLLRNVPSGSAKPCRIASPRGAGSSPFPCPLPPPPDGGERPLVSSLGAVPFLLQRFRTRRFPKRHPLFAPSGKREQRQKQSPLWKAPPDNGRRLSSFLPGPPPAAAPHSPCRPAKPSGALSNIRTPTGRVAPAIRATTGGALRLPVGPGSACNTDKRSASPCRSAESRQALLRAQKKRGNPRRVSFGNRMSFLSIPEVSPGRHQASPPPEASSAGMGCLVRNPVTVATATSVPSASVMRTS